VCFHWRSLFCFWNYGIVELCACLLTLSLFLRCFALCVEGDDCGSDFCLGLRFAVIVWVFVLMRVFFISALFYEDFSFVNRGFFFLAPWIHVHPVAALVSQNEAI